MRSRSRVARHDDRIDSTLGDPTPRASSSQRAIAPVAASSHRFESVDLNDRSATRELSLPEAALERMEASFRRDFSSIRWLEDPRAEELDALAFACQNSIVFAPGAFHPESHEGLETIAHELAHIVQQEGAGTAALPGVFALNDDPTLESRARSSAERAARGMPALEAGRLDSATPAVQRIVRPGRGEHSGKFYSTETQQYYDTHGDAQAADNAARAQRETREAAQQERRAEQRRARVAGDAQPVDAQWPLDQMTQVAHMRPRDPAYVHHSTTATAIPVTHEGFGAPVISQQRNDRDTVAELQRRLTAAGTPEPSVIPSLPSGHHADPYAAYQAFAGDFEETGELPAALLFGVSKGRCDDCDDALSDFPIVMDPSFRLGESTRQWKHARRQDEPDD
jgi:hypothetical protein